MCLNTLCTLFPSLKVLNCSGSVLLFLKANFSGGVYYDGQKQNVIALRHDGADYGSIVSQLGVSINMVESFS